MEAPAGRRRNGGDCNWRVTKRDGDDGDPPPWPRGVQGKNSGSSDDKKVFVTGAYGSAPTESGSTTPNVLRRQSATAATGLVALICPVSE